MKWNRGLSVPDSSEPRRMWRGGRRPFTVLEREFQIEAVDHFKGFVLRTWPTAAVVFFWCDPDDFYGPPQISAIFDANNSCLWVRTNGDDMRFTLQQYVDQIRNPSYRSSVALVQFENDPELYVFDLRTWPLPP